LIQFYQRRIVIPADFLHELLRTQEWRPYQHTYLLHSGPTISYLLELGKASIARDLRLP
jgi:hypothetical protein